MVGGRLRMARSCYPVLALRLLRLFLFWFSGVVGQKGKEIWLLVAGNDRGASSLWIRHIHRTVGSGLQQSLSVSPACGSTKGNRYKKK